ncbi:MAG: hypothetical protein ACK41F_00205 [Fimbriimonadaceae bacterium]
MAVWDSGDAPRGLELHGPPSRTEGRVERRDGALALHYGMCGARFRFEGPLLALVLQDDEYGGPNTVGVRIDGGPELVLPCQPDGRARLHLAAADLEPGWHEAHVYRRSAAWRGTLLWRGIALARGRAVAEAPAAEEGPALEMYGDSVLAGEAVEHVGFEEREDSVALEHSYAGPEDRATNAWWGYGAIVARRLGCRASIQGIGGLSLLDGTGWYCHPEAVGLESTFDKACPIPGRMTPWDFSLFRADWVLIGIGQNDANGGRPRDPDFRDRWKETYLRVIGRLREEHGGPRFLLFTTILMHDPVWDELLDEVAAEAGQGVLRHRFRRNGSATPGHPRIAEQIEMAEELAGAIRSELQ